VKRGSSEPKLRQEESRNRSRIPKILIPGREGSFWVEPLGLVFVVTCNFHGWF
jgi:hypothetical protein